MPNPMRLLSSDRPDAHIIEYCPGGPSALQFFVGRDTPGDPSSPFRLVFNFNDHKGGIQTNRFNSLEELGRTLAHRCPLPAAPIMSKTKEKPQC